MAIAEIEADAPGRDDETNAGEYVVLINRSTATVDISSWTISDDDGNTARICSPMSIPGDGSVRIYSNNGTNTPDRCFTGAGTYLNNDGDTLELKTAQGEVVDRLTYPG